MRIYAKIYSIIAVALGAFNACSLIHDDPEDCQLYTSEGVPYAYVAVAFNTGMNTSTRSNPTGGEDGDDPEVGQSNENQVNDITLFFYEVGEGDKGVNMPSTTPIVAWHHFGDEDIDAIPSNNHQIATTKPVEVTKLLVNHSYHVLAVVNGGENFGEGVKTLGDLQQMKVTSIYKTSGLNPTQEGYFNFLMASADDENYPLEIYPNNSETNPAHTVINVERVSARVDYRAIDPNGQPANDSIYEIDNVGTARITGALLVNTLNAGANSYLLKRVTKANAGFNTSVIYLGDETVNNLTDNVATNYVIDPYATSGKQETDFDPETYFPSIGYENAADWENLFSEGTKVSADGETWHLIGYPKENVNEKGSKRHSTGIIFKANITLTKAAPSATFFEWNGQVCRTAEEAMVKFDSDGWTNAVNGEWKQLNTYGDFRLMMQSMKSGDPTGYKLYLEKTLGEASDDTPLTDDIKATLRWAYYMEHECFYKNENGAVQVDIDQISGTTRQILSQYQLHTYKEGVCYYTYWIKHSNDDDEATDLLHGGTGGVMEYAIVRNNIYKLNVTSISTLGDDVPGDRTLEINFSVKNWQMMDDEEIPLEPVN